ncbi:uncharacterized protein LOC135485261 [Lineus longissimus]|uniref:uncharacterized protein LOC135485261 n=1 Tax=Lineus longissimus TaxID=88925 RepID=UPI00315DDECE
MKRVTAGTKSTASTNPGKTGRVFSPIRIFSDPFSSDDPDDVIPSPKKQSEPVPTKKRKTDAAKESTEVTNYVYEPKLFEEMPEVVPVKRTRRGRVAKSRGISDVSNIQRGGDNQRPQTRKRREQDVTAVKCQMQSDWIEPDLGDLLMKSSRKRQKKKTSKNRQIDNDKVKKKVGKKDDFSRPSPIKRSSVPVKSMKSKVKRVKSIGGESTALSEADILKNVNSSPDPTFKVQFVKSWVDESMEAIESGDLAQWSDEQTLKSSQENSSDCSSLSRSKVLPQLKIKPNGAPTKKAEDSGTRAVENTSEETEIPSPERTIQVAKILNVPRKACQKMSGSNAVILQILSTRTAGIASKVLGDLNQDNPRSKQLKPKKLTPVPIQNVFKKPATNFVPKVDPLLSGLMHCQEKSVCPQLNTSNLVYLKRFSKSSKHDSLSKSSRTSQSSGKETSSKWKTVDSSAVTRSQNESTYFTEDVTDDLMTEDLIDTTTDTERRATKMTDSTQEHTFGTLGTTDLIEGATADVMTEDFVTTYPTSSTVEIEVLRDAHVGPDTIKRKKKMQNQLVDDNNMKKVPHKVLAKLVDLNFVCDRSDKPGLCLGSPIIALFCIL